MDTDTAQWILLAGLIMSNILNVYLMWRHTGSHLRDLRSRHWVYLEGQVEETKEQQRTATQEEYNHHVKHEPTGEAQVFYQHEGQKKPRRVEE